MMKILNSVIGCSIVLLTSCSQNVLTSENKEVEIKEKIIETIPPVVEEANKDSLIYEISEAEMNKMWYDNLTFEDYCAFQSDEEISQHFGPNEIEKGTQLFQEGTSSYEYTMLTNPSTTHKIKYAWNEDGSLMFVEAKYIKRNEQFEEEGIQMTRSKSGIHLGMKLSELIKWNKANIDFYGFGWDFEGGIQTKEGSKLSELDFIIHLGIKYDANNPSEVMGDILLNSSNDALKGLDVFVNKISYYSDVE